MDSDEIVLQKTSRETSPGSQSFENSIWKSKLRPRPNNQLSINQDLCLVIAGIKLLVCLGLYELAQSSHKGDHNTTYLTAIFHYLWLELNPYRMPSCQFGTLRIGISPISGAAWRLRICLNSKSLSISYCRFFHPEARLVAAFELLPTFLDGLSNPGPTASDTLAFRVFHLQGARRAHQNKSYHQGRLDWRL
jgi:hypothetical protein